ncbi:uncharacterized protein LOC132607864 [Lycium barbarum]|uniref:uncharacterized protein LOC132607864 n=1 Tax=Lycium barbarum TaxID=112863 RepID=UPI00293F345C|nr:uncharacterized protein LOC132607864 [Lycium barbarum]
MGHRFVKKVNGQGEAYSGKASISSESTKDICGPKGSDLEFGVGKQVLLKISPMKRVMRFGKTGKLSPKYLGPFEVLRRVGDVAYELALPPGLSGVHPVRWDSVLLDENLSYDEESITILDR